MRLSTDVFEALDMYMDENIRLTRIIASGGRFGLIPVSKPFELSVNISGNVLEVVSLSCHGVTKSGMMVDIDFDSNYTNTFDTRVVIPTANDDEAFLIVVKFHRAQWREVNEICSEAAYTFELVGENSIIDNDSLPIGRIVNQYGWRLDETEFVPPCLYVSAHPRYVELVSRAKSILKSISDRCLAAHNCVARHLLGTLWPCVVYAHSDIDKAQEVLLPASVFSSIQKVVSAFIIGCSIDEYISLEDADSFVAYHQKPYNGKSICQDIEKGLELCSEIAIKMDAVCSMTETRAVPPSPVERPIPKPQPTPEPQPTGRNRWEGIEI